MEGSQSLSHKLIASAVAFALALSMGFGYVFTAGASMAYGDDAGTGTDNAQTTDAIDITDLIPDCGDQFYTGQAVEPYSSAKVKINGETTRLKAGTDYTVTYENNIEKGTATATLVATGEKYTGTAVKTFDIIAYELNVSIDGKAVKSLSEYDLQALAVKSKDNTNDLYYQYAGTGSMTVIYVPGKQYVTYDAIASELGIAEWASAKTAAPDGFGTTVTRYAANNGKWYPAAGVDFYSTQGAKAVPAIHAFKYGDASVESSASVACSAAKEKLTTVYRNFVGIPESEFNSEGAIGGNRFATGVNSLEFTSPTNLSDATVTLAAANCTYDGKAKSPAVVSVKLGDTALAEGVDYTVSYANNVKAGTATVKVSGINAYTGTVSKTFKISSVSITSAKKALSSTTYTYTGKAKSPAATLTYGGKKLVKGTDYTITYKNNTKVGKATAIIKGTGNFKGSTTLSFTINPKGTSVSKTTAAKKAFTVTWKKQSTQTTGYQVRYSTAKSMKGALTKNVKSTSKTSLKVSNLKNGKKYYVQVRTYKKVGNATYYSGWSTAKAVTTK